MQSVVNASSVESQHGETLHASRAGFEGATGKASSTARIDVEAHIWVIAMGQRQVQFLLAIIARNLSLFIVFGINSNAQTSGGNFKDRHFVGNWLLPIADRRVNKPMDRQVLGDTAV